MLMASSSRIFRASLKQSALVVAIFAAVFLAVLPDLSHSPGVGAQNVLTLVSNLGQANAPTSDTLTFIVGDFTLPGEMVPTDIKQATSFTTGSNTGGYVLSSIEILANASNNEPLTERAPDVPRVTIRENDDDDEPGDEVHTLTNPDLPTDHLTPTSRVFTAPSDATLDASTTYWVVFEDVTQSFLRPQNNYHIRATTLDAEDDGGQAGWSIGNDSLRFGDDDANWTMQDNPFKIKVSGTAATGVSPGVTISESSLTVTEEAATGDTYTVVLDTQPTQDVTVTPSAPDGSPVSISPAGLTFTSENWATAQTVTVTGTADDDLENTDVTISHSVASADTDYQGISVDSVTVTVTDNDSASVTVSTNALTVAEEGTGTYTVVLDQEPNGTVTITITRPSGNVNPDVTLDTDLDTTGNQNTLTFTAANWDTAQTVTVAAADDGDPDNDMATINHAASGANFGSATFTNGTITVTVTDNDTAGVAINPTTLTIEEGEAGTYKVKLNSLPTQTVTVTPMAQGLTISPASLMFTTESWRTEQDVTVTTAEDVNLVDESITISHGVENYAGVTSAPDVTVSVTDDDEAGVTVSPTTITVPEGSTEDSMIAGATYTVVLDFQPSASVSVGITGPTGSDLTISATSLTFTTSNWNTAQSVTVTAAEDHDSADDTGLTITHAVTSTDTNYDGESADSVSVTVDDDDTDGVSITPTTLMVTEATGTDHAKNYTVVLDTVPSGNVVVTLSVGDGSGVTVSGTTLDANNRLTFTTGNWSTPQTVTVTAASDDDAFDNSGSITHTVSGYGSVTSATAVSVSVEDDEEAAVVLGGTTVTEVNEVDIHSLTVTEDTDTTTYTIKLASEPHPSTQMVTVTITAPTGLKVDPSTHTFISGETTEENNNWDDPITVMITALDDEDGVDANVSITHAVAGADYEDVNAPPIGVTVTDDDTPAVDVSKSSLTIEEGESDVFTVQLTTRPTEAVEVRFSEPGNSDLGREPPAITFNPDNWGNPHEVTLTVAEDDDARDESDTITYTATQTGGNQEYNNKTGSISVTIEDDEEAMVIVSTEDLTITEGSTGTYTLVLSHQVVASGGNSFGVKPSISATDAGVTFSPSQVAWNRNDWNMPETVTVTATEDDDGDDETVTITHAVGDYDDGYDEYVGVTIASVTVTVRDNDPTGVTISKSSLEIDEGNSGTYTVVLDTKPGGNVVITPSATGSDLTFNPTSLTFEPDAWNTAQTITVTDFGDPDAQDDTPTIEHAVTGYGDVEADDVTVTVEDDDERMTQHWPQAEEEITPGVHAITVHEGSTTGTWLRFRLSTQPINPDGTPGSVTITVTPPTGMTATPNRLVKTAANYSNWESGQILLRAGHDVNAINEHLSLAVAISGADYDSDTYGPIPVVVRDDDEPSLTLSRTTVTDVDEGSATARTYTIRPAYEPSGELTVNLTTDNSDVTITPTSLTFNASDYTTPQTVSLTAGQDDDAFDDSATISHTVSMTAGQEEYHEIDVDDVTVTLDDDDTPRVQVNPATLTINEPDTGTSTATYVVTLATLPVDSNGDASSVEVTITDPTNTDITASPATVTLSSSNWSSGETVTVSVIPDADTQRDTGTVTHSASGADYGSAGADSVAVTVVDTDTPNVLISPSNVTVTEGASDGTYTVVLSTQPASNVTVTPTSTNSEVTFSPATLTFSNTTWNTAQTVTLTAAEDYDAANDTGRMTHSSSGADYGGLTITAVDVTVTDNDTLQLVTAPTTLVITEVEGGTGTATYTVTAHAAPTGGNLTVTINRTGDTNVTTNPTSLTFSASEWTTQQTVSKTVTVNVSDDADAVDDSATISHVVGGSSDYADEGITTDPVAVTITDTDEQAVRIVDFTDENTEITALTVTEGSTERYKVVLDTQPTGNVTISVVNPTDSVVSATPPNLIFTADNWDDAQVVTVTGGPDDDANPDTGTITHTVAGADYGDENVTADSVTVTVTDIDIRGVEILTTADPYLFGEGESITYQLRLDTEPNGTVTVTPASTNGDISFDPTSVEFDADDWDTFKTIEVTAGQDPEADAETATVTHTVSGADYGANNVEVTDVVNLDIADDDEAEVLVPITEMTITEGAGGAYTVVLGSRPVGGNVTVTIAVVGSPDLSVTPNVLTFTTTNWNQAVTVTVSAAEDDDTRADRGTVRHTVSGANFGDATIPDISVTVVENDMPEIVVEPLSLLLGEGNSTSYTVALGTEPSGDVTVQASSNNADASLSPVQLTFTSTDWNEPQAVTVTASSDTDPTNDAVAITHLASGSEYAQLAGPTVSALIVEDGSSIPNTSSFLRSSSCDNQLTLTWNAPTPDDAPVIASFQIQWKTGDAEFGATNQATAPADAMSYTLDSLSNEVSYDIRVTALDEMSGPLWLREITAMPSDSACIAEVSFGNILADSTPVIIEVEDPEPGTRVNMRWRSLNPGVWSEVQSEVLDPGETSVTFDIRGLNPSSNYEIQTWLGSATPPRELDRSDTAAASETSVAQVVFTSGHAPPGTTIFRGGSRGGRILRIEPTIRAVTVGPGDEVVLSVEVYGRQEIHDNGLADKDPADGRPTFTWSSDGAGVFREADIRTEWSNGFADDREVSFTAPGRAGTTVVVVSLDGAADCLAAREGETADDQEARCSARIEVTVKRRLTIRTETTVPVNPPGVIPETLTDPDGVAYAVFTPVDGGSFVGDGYSLTAGPGSVADGEFIGIRMARVGDASNVGQTWHRYTLAGPTYALDVVDSAGDEIADYALGEAVTVCAPLPDELRGNISDIVLVSSNGSRGLTVLSSRVRIIPDGTLVCGALSTLPANLAVGKSGSPPEVVDEEEAVDAGTPPDTGGVSVGQDWVLWLLVVGSAAVVTGALVSAGIPTLRRMRDRIEGRSQAARAPPARISALAHGRVRSLRNSNNLQSSGRAGSANGSFEQST